jgi:polyphosphate:AMP phosphotransferase
MIRTKDRGPAPDKKTLKERLKEERARLTGYQMKIKEAKLPVMVIFEGWGAAGKGSMIARVINNIDPRFFEVARTNASPTEEELRKPFLYRYIKEIPENGKFKFFDTCWMEEVTDGVLENRLSEEEYKRRVLSIRTAERQLVDNGYLIVKCFLDISRKEQKRRLDALDKDKNTHWRVTAEDRWENSHYDRCAKVYHRFLEDTDWPDAPWFIIESKQEAYVELQVLESLNNGIEHMLEYRLANARVIQNPFRLVKRPPLAEVSLDKSLSDKEYKTELRALTARLHELHYELYRRKIPVIIAYEGWDAAGKGGNIRRITAALDPRGYIVHPIASPEPHEKARHYLWRFWNRLPKSGHIAIFDRTWYGRVMVERIEGFCSENDWQRAYNEINEFEKELTDWGAVVIKFWIQIDKDTQLARFNDRQNTPEKQWKITDEDWRNREKWDAYELAVDEMIARTSTSFAPWHILESADKKYARIKALKVVLAALEKACEKKKS